MTGLAQRRRRLASPTTAAILGALSVLLVLAASPLEVLDPGSLSVTAASDPVSVVLSVVFLLAFAAAGVVVARREPQNPMGWLLLAVALVWEVGDFAGAYSYQDYVIDHGTLPLGHVAMLGNAAQTLFYGLLIFPLIILCFPDGRLGRRWRWPLRGYLVICLLEVTVTVKVVVDDFRLRQPFNSSGNLVGLGPWSPFVRHVEGWTLLAVFGLSIAAAVYQVRNFRRASGERRQQLKWLGSAAAICAVTLPTFVWENAPPLVADLLPLALTAVPIAIGVGILRYRLYEIDRLFSRTLSYVILTALLAGTFVGVVALTTDLLPFSSGVGVAASTLAATVLFNPLRRRVQRIVDRRFNRSRYDAERIVEAFAARLRDAVELESVEAELLDVVQRALEPAHASLWIRPSAPAPRPVLPLDQGPHARVERVTL